MHGVASGLALDALCVVDVGRAASDATFRVNGVDTACGRSWHSGAGVETRWERVAVA